MTTTTVPAWAATTAYLAGAIVSQSGKVLPLWRCTVAGTSGNAEPTWPTASPWTVTDGGVTWTLNTTFREDVRAGIATTLDNWRAANPSLLRKVWQVRPQSFTLGDLPCAVIGNMTETITTMNGIRQRKLDGFTVELVDRTPDNAEAAARMDALVDALLDYLTAAYHAASGTSILEPIGVSDGGRGETEATNLSWYSNLINFEAYVAEGRT